MRRSAQLAGIGITMLLAGGGTAAAAESASTTGPGAAASASTSHGSASRWSGTCHLSATSRELGTPRIPLRSAHSKQSGHATGGTIEATIPTAVFIRAAGRQLTITTNTGRSPRAGDQFYFVANGRAGMASGELKRRVETDCD
jgi:hypothetical protein